ncbi:MAG: hypothetical protein BroJett040_13860 [Oligoflexia bacterium]|nr:MAG: hypothetical protein BroJett040_13860 [Oligoflexia bacterium]
MITDRLSLGPPGMGGASGLGFGDKLQPESRAKDKGSESFEAALQDTGAKQEIRQMSKEPKSNSRTLDQAADRVPEQATQQKNLSVSRKSEAGEKIESKSEVEETNSEMKGPILTQKQKVMQKFMDSIESEFSIPPERIVEAMAQLSDEDLLKSPEETASQIISKLGLDSEEESRAEALYVSMLTDLSKVPQQPIIEKELVAQSYLHPQQAVAAPRASMMQREPEFISQKERRAILNDSLDRMNNKFFMTQPMKAQHTVKPEMAMQMSPQEEELYAQISKGQQFEQPIQTMNTLDSLKFERLPQDQMSPQLVRTRQSQYAEMQKAFLSPEQLQAQAQQQPEAVDQGYHELAAKLAALGATAGALNEIVVKDPNNQVALQMEQSMNGFELPQVLQTPTLNGRSGFQGGQSDSSQQGEFNSDQDFMKNSKSEKPALGKEEFFPHHQVDPGQPTLKSEASAGLAAGAASQVVGRAETGENEANIRQLMNQAQYMMKKGGGEAVVKLTPEGLGQVHLKVVVNEGKVNLEMSAENKDAKKLIENSIGDLKSSLHTRNLTVDSIKVDVGNQLSSDNNSQSQNQSSQFKFDQGREQARQFLQNFQEQNNSQRGTFFEMPGLKTYGTRNNPDPMRPADEIRTRSRRYESTGKGAGIDLVA